MVHSSPALTRRAGLAAPVILRFLPSLGPLLAAHHFRLDPLAAHKSGEQNFTNSMQAVKVGI